MAEYKQNREFAAEICRDYMLDDAIDWIKINLDPEEVFDEDQLREWARDNGYREQED